MKSRDMVWRGRTSHMQWLTLYDGLQVNNLIALSRRNKDCSIRYNLMATIYFSNFNRRLASFMIKHDILTAQIRFSPE